MHFKNTPYGFEYGSATITRAHSDNKKGFVVLLLETPREEIQIYVTKTGLIRVSNAAAAFSKMLRAQRKKDKKKK